MNNLTSKVKELLFACGMEAVGITDPEHLKDAPEGYRPTDILPTTKSVVCAIVHIADTVCDDLPYTRYEYTNQFFILNSLLNSTATKLTRMLEEEGYRTVPIPAAYPRVNKEVRGVLSHRHCAVAAGLGEFAFNNLMTTEKYGSRVRIITIITEAELDIDQPSTQNLCAQYRAQGLCDMDCVKRCPTGALSCEGVIDKYKCLHYQEQIMPWSAAELRCGLCLAACPIGKRKFKGEPGERSESVKAMKEKQSGHTW